MRRLTETVPFFWRVIPVAGFTTPFEFFGIHPSQPKTHPRGSCLSPRSPSQRRRDARRAGPRPQTGRGWVGVLVAWAGEVAFWDDGRG
jgi:hypothetical protein